MLWNELFTRRKTGGTGWLYADGGRAIAVSESRFVWFFGDTLLEAPDGRRMVAGNTLGVFDGATPEEAAQNARFYASTGDPLEPIDVTTGRLSSPQPFYALGSSPPPVFGPGSRWLWPGAGVVVDGVLYSMWTEMRCGEGPLEDGCALEIVSQYLFALPDPMGDPLTWPEKTRRYPLPSVEHGVVWHALTLVDDRVYVFGVGGDPCEPASGGGLKLARIPRSTGDLEGVLADYASWEFLGTDGWRTGVPVSHDELRTIADHVTPAFSIDRLEVSDGSMRWLIVHGSDPFPVAYIRPSIGAQPELGWPALESGESLRVELTGNTSASAWVVAGQRHLSGTWGADAGGDPGALLVSFFACGTACGTPLHDADGEDLYDALRFVEVDVGDIEPWCSTEGVACADPWVGEIGNGCALREVATAAN